MRAFSVAALASTWAGAHGSMCPGSFDFSGYGQVSLTNTGYANGGTEGARGKIAYDTAAGGAVALHLNDRSYFGDVCDGQGYAQQHFSAVRLLGKRMRYTTELSGADCGCNVAMYLVSMHQNFRPSKCGDYYCDANSVCGVACTEIDIQEANVFSWHSTVHSKWDKYGAGSGYGGGGKNWNGPRDFNGQQYGPGGYCVDTTKPFQVSASFPVGGDGMLIAMEVELSQEGKWCPLKMRAGPEYAGMVELTAALWRGMTPVVSYWKSEDMYWMDGKGMDGRGPCSNDTAKCEDYAKFYDFSVEDLPGASVWAPQAALEKIRAEEAEDRAAWEAKREAEQEKKRMEEFAKKREKEKEAAKEAKAEEKRQKEAKEAKAAILAGTAPAEPGENVPWDDARSACTETGEDCRKTHCCRSSGMQCFEKNKWWAECREACLPGRSSPEEESSWSCRPLGERTPDFRDQEIVMLRVPQTEAPELGAQVTLVNGGQQVLGSVVTESDPLKGSVDPLTLLRQRGSSTYGEGEVTTLDGAVANKTNSSKALASSPPVIHA